MYFFLPIYNTDNTAMTSGALAVTIGPLKVKL